MLFVGVWHTVLIFLSVQKQMLAVTTVCLQLEYGCLPRATSFELSYIWRSQEAYLYLQVLNYPQSYC